MGIRIHVVKLVYTKHMQYTWGAFRIHAVHWVAYSYSSHTVNKFSICDAWLVHEVQRVYMRYRHTTQLVLSIWILYGCHTWGTVGIYEIQLVCILCMGLNMRYSGYKWVKKINQSTYSSPSMIIIIESARIFNFNTFFFHANRSTAFLNTHIFQHQPGGVF